MEIIIKADEIRDAATLDGFASATGWSDKIGIKKSEWIAAKVSAYVAQTARRGFVTDTTAAVRGGYLSAFSTAQVAARSAIADPGATVEAGLLGAKEPLTR